MHRLKRKQMAEYLVKRCRLAVPLAVKARVVMMFLLTALAQNSGPLSFSLAQTSNTIVACLGSYTGRSPGFTNEYRSFTFKWDPAAVAIVHTHPNSSDPRPSEQDKRVADKYRIPIFTIIISGRYVYDPATKKTSKVLNNLDWLDPVNLSRWGQEMARGVYTTLHQVPVRGLPY